jgi:aspartyl/asparaginyl-tRNA synthetase
MKNVLFIVPSWINFSLSNVYITQVEPQITFDDYVKLIKAAENSFKKIVIYTNDFPKELLNWLYETNRDNDKYTIKIIDNREAHEKLRDYLEINWEWIVDSYPEEELFDKQLDQFIIDNKEILKKRGFL